MAEEKKESKILNITKLKITCENCNTVVETDLGTTILGCPACNTNFGVKRDGSDDYFVELYNVLQKMKFIKSAKFSLICEDD